MRDKELRMWGEEIVNDAVDRVMSVKRKNNNFFAATEKRLFAYPLLKENIETYMKDISDIEKEDLSHSKDIVIYRPNCSGEKPDIEELRQAKILVIRRKMLRDQRELDEIERALQRIADDEWHEVVECYYFQRMSAEKMEEKFNCAGVTLWRQRKRLINEMSIVLYGAEALQ